MSYNKLAPILVIVIIPVASMAMQTAAAQNNSKLVKYGVSEYAYHLELLGSLIIGEIPPIPLGLETYSRLIEIYGSQLEMCPAFSGRLQLYYTQ